MPGADVGGLLRSGVACLCLAAGVLHVSAAADHRGMAGHVAFFLAVAVIQSALAAAVLLGRRRGGWLAAAAAVNLAVAFVWVISRTAGLPVDGSSAPEALGFKDGISTMLEIGASAGAGLWWLLPDGARRVGLPSGRLATALLSTGVWAVGAAGLFAGHTHSPGHNHAGQHPRATAPTGAEHAHAPGPNHDDHARPVDSATAAADHDHARFVDPASAAAHPTGSHPQAAAVEGATHGPGHHSDEPMARSAAIRTSGDDGHASGHDRPHNNPRPVPSSTAGHRHDHEAAANPAEDGSGHGSDGHDGSHEGGAGDDHRHSGDDHDHNHDDGSGNDKGDEDGGASPLEDVLKLIRPR